MCTPLGSFVFGVDAGMACAASSWKKSSSIHIQPRVGNDNCRFSGVDNKGAAMKSSISVTQGRQSIVIGLALAAVVTFLAGGPASASSRGMGEENGNTFSAASTSIQSPRHAKFLDLGIIVACFTWECRSSFCCGDDDPYI